MGEEMTTTVGAKPVVINSSWIRGGNALVFQRSSALSGALPRLRFSRLILPNRNEVLGSMNGFALQPPLWFVGRP